VLITLGKNAIPGRHLPIADLQVLTAHTINPETEGLLTVASVDSSYPSFSKAQNWGGVEFYQVVRLQLPQASPETRVAAALSDGSPLLVDRRIGEGHVLVFTSSFDNIASNLPVSPVWLPFLDQTTSEMGGIGTAPGNYKVGSFVELRTAKEKDVPVEIVGPNDKRLLTLAESTKARTFQFPSQGFFDVRRANGREELASVNADRRESDFTIIPAETLELWKNTGIASKQGLSSASSTNQGESRSELWLYVLAMLAVLAIAESVLGNRHMTAAQTAGDKE
jgi:hypothetical protein